MIEYAILTAKHYSEIYTDNTETNKKRFRELSKIYHPDISKSENANEIFVKLSLFFEQSEQAIKDGCWQDNDTIILEEVNGKKHKLSYLKKDSFELGEIYIARTHLVYIFNETHEKYYNNALYAIKNLKYDNKEMEKEFARYFPKIVSNFKMKDNRYCIVMSKTYDIFRLKDIKNVIDLDSKHTAWIISRLLNIACYLTHNKMVHNGLSLENIFISPRHHTVCIYGGWWYTVQHNHKMIGVQKSVFDLMPIKNKHSKTSTYRTDLESIKQIGRLCTNNTMPNEFKQWLQKAIPENAFILFKEWELFLEKMWGKRKFIELKVSENDIYK